MSDDPLSTAAIPAERQSYSRSPAPSSATSNAPSTSRPRRDRPPVDYTVNANVLSISSPGADRIPASDKGKGRASTGVARVVRKKSTSGKTSIKRRGLTARPKSAFPQTEPDTECSFCEMSVNE